VKRPNWKAHRRPHYRIRIKRIASATSCFVAIWGLITVFAVIAIHDGLNRNADWLFLGGWGVVILIELWAIAAAIYYWIKEPWTRRVYFDDDGPFVGF
jgi:fumarate reductase subunit C